MNTLIWLWIGLVSSTHGASTSSQAAPAASASGGAATTAANAPATCPADRRVDISPEAWKAELEHAKPDDYLAVLQKMKLDLTVKAINDPTFGKNKLERVDLYSERLSGAKEPERVVQAKFSTNVVEDGNELSPHATRYRIQVLRKLSGGGWCALGSDLSEDLRDQDHTASPAEGAHYENGPMTFAFVKLTSKDHSTIEVSHSGKSISRINGTSSTRDYWDVGPQGLVKVLSLTEQNTSSYFTDPYQHVHVWYELSATPPKRATVFTVQCTAADGGGPCTPPEKVEWVFENGTYVEKK
jgi:hypothetical protein